MEKRNRLSSEVSSHQLTSFVAWKSAGKAIGTVCGVKQPHMGEVRIEVTDRRMPCSAQVRLHTEAGMRLNFVCYEILPGIGWRAECMQPLLRLS